MGLMGMKDPEEVLVHEQGPLMLKLLGKGKDTACVAMYPGQAFIYPRALASSVDMLRTNWRNKRWKDFTNTDKKVMLAQVAKSNREVKKQVSEEQWQAALARPQGEEPPSAANPR